MAITVADIERICEQDNFLFTTKDLTDLHQALTTGQVFDIQGLVDYFNARFKCNQIVDLLKQVIDNGVQVVPKVNIQPITEKCEVKDGVFTLTKVPIQMGNAFFINNLVVVRLRDDKGNLLNTYEMFDDVNVELDNLMCTLSTPINGVASVSYFTYPDN